MAVEIISFPWKDVAGREDRTRDRQHTRQMRIRPSCHARLRPSKNNLCLSCIIPRGLLKPFKQMGWKWRFSEENHQAIHKQNYFFFSNKSSCECFLIYCLCQSLLWSKDEISKDYFREVMGAKPPRNQIIFILTVLSTTYVLFRYFAFASMCYSLLPIMLNIFEGICQLAADFYETKKTKKKNTHILVEFYPSKSVKYFSLLLLTICKRQFSVSNQFFFSTEQIKIKAP